MQKIDCLIVGAGFAGMVLAERLGNVLGWHCVVVDRRAHLGGNAHDAVDAAGVLIHTYGPHYFRTNSPRIREYLSHFTQWHQVTYRVQSHAEGRYWSFPVNLATYEQLIGRPATSEEFIQWLDSRRLHLTGEPKNSEEVILSQTGPEFYELFFKGYTLKQWRRHPRDLDASVCGRIPIRTNRDDRYLTEEFQALPKEGYTAMFNRLLQASPKTELKLGMDFATARRIYQPRHTIYTGPIDEYFDFTDGRLPYRSLRFERESFGPDQLTERLSIARKPGFWQPEMQVNYPGAEPFTRIVELKHATGQNCENTTIVREYPEDYLPGREPYYPIPAPDAQALYKKYAQRAALEENVSFVGRLATYRYYNMDQVVGMALAEFDRLRARYADAS